MLGFLAIAVLLASAADNWTTYLCLHSPVEGYEVREVNPFAEWLFHQFGLVPGLVLDGFLTTGAVAFLLVTHRLPRGLRVALLFAIAAWTAAAVANNLDVLAELGLSPLG